MIDNKNRTDYKKNADLHKNLIKEINEFFKDGKKNNLKISNYYADDFIFYSFPAGHKKGVESLKFNYLQRFAKMKDRNISLKIVHDLLAGIKSDIKDKVLLNSKKDLLIYSYRVAGTVGLMMAKILKVDKKNSLKSAIDLGIAMQLTNISRDVIEDSKNNRFYINRDFREISSTINLADSFYQNSFYSIKNIPISFRFSILVARRVYRKIGRKILGKKNLVNYQNSGKIYVSNIEKLLETFLSIFDLVRLSLTVKNEDQIQHDHVLINEEINLDERI